MTDIEVRPLTADDVPACVWGSCHTACCAGNPHERPKIDTIRVRPLITEDVPACVALQQCTFPPELWEDADEYETLRASHGLSVAIVDKTTGDFWGYAMVHWTDGDISELAQGHYPRSPEMTTICIHDFVLDATLQGRGVGRHVVCDVLFPQWRAAGARDVCLLSVPEAIGFWRRLGFETVREYRPKANCDGVAYPAGSLVMRLSLF